MAKFNVQAARKAGYTDAEIADYLATESKFNVAGAREAGYSDGQIIAELTKPKREVGAIEAAVLGFERGLKPVAEFARRFDPLSYAGDALFGTKARDAIEQRLAAAAQEAEAARPNYFTGGKIAGQIAGTAPVMALGGGAIAGGGRALAGVAPRLAPVVERFGQAVASGGIGTGRTAAQTATRTGAQRLGELATRSAGGAASGAGSAALTNEDVGASAAFGAGLPIVASIIRRAGGKVLDLGRGSALQAARIMRESLGSNLEEAKAAFAALPPNQRELARQTLIKAGIEPRAFMGVGADVERLMPDQTAAILGEQATAREARLAQAAGGATATATRAATDVGRRAVSQATGPAREAALARANVAGQEVPRAEVLAEAARRAANQMTESGLVPRMRGLETRSREQLDTVFQNPAFFTQSQPVVRTGEVAEKAGQLADKSIEAQLGLRQTARDMEDYVADLAAQGMKPLEVAPIVQQIRSMAGQPGTRADTLQRGTLIKLANQLESLADANGVINARDLYQIRKTGLNDIVDRLLGARAQPSSGAKERTASLLTDVRKMIDNAIEDAGGAGWKDYLDLTRRGFEAVNRQELGAKAAQMAKDSPNEFIALMRGERPQVVEDIMGKGTNQYDIAGMALADPRRYLALKQSADELGVLNRMTELGREGSTVAGELITKNRASPLVRGLTGMALSTSPAARIATQGAETVRAAMLAPEVRQELAQGFMGAPQALSLLEQYPTSSRAAEAISKLSPGMRNAIAQLLSRQYNQ